MKRKKRQHIIGIRVDDDLFNRLSIRALRQPELTSISRYCYNLIYNDVYRNKDRNPLNIHPMASGKEETNGS